MRAHPNPSTTDSGPTRPTTSTLTPTAFARRGSSSWWNGARPGQTALRGTQDVVCGDQTQATPSVVPRSRTASAPSPVMARTVTPPAVRRSVAGEHAFTAAYCYRPGAADEREGSAAPNNP